LLFAGGSYSIRFSFFSGEQFTFVLHQLCCQNALTTFIIVLAQDIIPLTILNTEHDLFIVEYVVINSNAKFMWEVSKYDCIKLYSSTIGRP